VPTSFSPVFALAKPDKCSVGRCEGFFVDQGVGVATDFREKRLGTFVVAELGEDAAVLSVRIATDVSTSTLSR
jgi:hypothetical protein